MTDGYNPYQAPAADLAALASPSSPDELYTPLMLQHLKDTKPWVRFLSIMGFIATGLMVLGTIGVLIVAAVGPAGDGEEAALMMTAGALE